MTGVVPELASLTDEEICLEIAKRLRVEHLRKDLSQIAMSKLSGIPLRTYKRLEANGTGSIMTLVAAMRAYDRLRGFHLFTATAHVSGSQKCNIGYQAPSGCTTKVPSKTIRERVQRHVR